MTQNVFPREARCNRRRSGIHAPSLAPLTAILALGFTLGMPSVVEAQQPGAGAQPAQRSPREAAPIDLTGQWVAVITEDWRYRMMLPPKGDAASVPLNAAGRAAAGDWDPDADEAAGEQCRAYGAAAIMRLPTRLRISWQGDSALQIETDAGRQVRRLNFEAAPRSAGEQTWQGQTTAEWLMFGAGGRFGGAPQSGSLRTVTTGMRAGYLRKNGIPYSSDAVVTEVYDILNQPDGSQWLVVKVVVDDPTYLTQPFVTSSNFKRESDTRNWNPQPCSVN